MAKSRRPKSRPPQPAPAPTPGASVPTPALPASTLDRTPASTSRASPAAYAWADYAALIGLDWADQKHDVCLLDTTQAIPTAPEYEVLAHTPEALMQWLNGLRARFGGRPIAVCLELSRGPLIQVLRQYDFIVLYPVNPQTLAKFRQTFTPSGAKADASDAAFLVRLLSHHHDVLRPFFPDDATTRALATLVLDRRKAVDARTALTNRLQSVLKSYFPQALTLCGDKLHQPLAMDFLDRYPTLAAAQRAKPKTVAAFYRQRHCRSDELIAARLQVLAEALPLTTDWAVIRPAVLTVKMLVLQLRQLQAALGEYDRLIEELFTTHPDAALFDSLPGAGPALAPRLLVAFGTQRERFPSASAMQQYSGVAPVTKTSGKSRQVQSRWCCPHFLRQSLHEFARCSIGCCGWAHAYYTQQRARGNDHHAAVRALAYKWVRIIWRLWQDGALYVDATYVQALRRHGSPLVAALDLPTVPA